MKICCLLAAAMLVHAFEISSVEFRPSASNRIAIEVGKTGLLRGKTHVFVFGRYRGAAVYNDQRPELSKVQLEIEANSITNQDTWVSDKDKVKVMNVALHDMLAADKYPTITFVSNHVTVKGPSQFEVTGSLSLRGIIQTATVLVTKNGDVYDGTSSVNMKDFGLKPPSTVFGAVGTKEVMTVKFHLTAAR
jgi:polyisoprenoid-binding protein YceI